MGDGLAHGPTRARPEPVADGLDVSVVITAYRRERELLEALQSVVAQRGPRIEVLVVDGGPGSAEAVVADVGDARVRYCRRRGPATAGPALARNEGAALARGRFVLFLDDDDRLAEGGLAALVGALDGHPRDGMAFGEVVPFGGDAQALAHERAYFARAARVARRARTRFGLARRLLFDNAPLVCSACLVRRELVAGCGGFDPDLPVCEDVDLYLRVIRQHGFVFVPRPVLLRRIGIPQLSASRTPGLDPRFARAYESIYAGYRRRHGLAELLALKIAARLLH